jgi:uncharacterized protein YjbJ (UPF0337 family)
VAEVGDTVAGAASIVNGSNTVPHLTQVHATHHAAEIGQDPNFRSFKEPRQDLTVRRKQMNPSTKDEVKGTIHEVKGKVKEKTGQVTNNPDLEIEGKAEHNAGKVEKKIGQIEKVFEK